METIHTVSQANQAGELKLNSSFATGEAKPKQNRFPAPVTGVDKRRARQANSHWPREAPSGHAQEVARRQAVRTRCTRRPHWRGRGECSAHRAVTVRHDGPGSGCGVHAAAPWRACGACPGGPCGPWSWAWLLPAAPPCATAARPTFWGAAGLLRSARPSSSARQVLLSCWAPGDAGGVTARVVRPGVAGPLVQVKDGIWPPGV